jgi:hypothetical protein
MKYTLLLIFIVFILAACTPAAQPTDAAIETLPPDTAVTSPPEQTEPANEPTQNPNPFAPAPGDADLTRGEVLFRKQTC